MLTSLRLIPNSASSNTFSRRNAGPRTWSALKREEGSPLTNEHEVENGWSSVGVGSLLGTLFGMNGLNIGAATP